LKEEWNGYKSSLAEALSRTEKLIDETDKYEKITAGFADWITAMEQCPDNEVRAPDSGFQTFLW